MRGINYIEKKKNPSSLQSAFGAEVIVLHYKSTDIMKTISKIMTAYAKYSSSPTSATIWLLRNNQKGIILARNWWMPDGVELVFCNNHVLKRFPYKRQKISAHLIGRNFAHLKAKH